MKESPACKKCVLLFAKHGEHLSFFIILLYFFTLLCSILLLLISSFKFLLRLKAVTGKFWKISLNDLFIDKVFQCLRATLLIFGRDRLYVNTSGIFVSFKAVSSLFFKVLSFPVFLLLLYVYLLPRVGNVDWQTSVWVPRNSDWSHLM